MHPWLHFKTITKHKLMVMHYCFLSLIHIQMCIRDRGETIKIPTGIRVEMDQEWVLKCYPRSGLGFKFRLQLNNTVGIIDSDYFYSDNEGHIFAKLTNDTNENKVVELKADTGFCLLYTSK